MNITIPIKIRIKAKATSDSDQRKLELIEQRLVRDISDEERQYLTDLRERLNGNVS